MSKDDKYRKYRIVKLLAQATWLMPYVEDSYMSQDPNDFDFFNNQSEPDDYEDGE